MIRHCDIVSIISSYVKLRRRGRFYVGLCPFHSEKSPSFTVYEHNQSFYCYGCGVGGDVIHFVRRMENLEYVDAIRFLAQRAGMQVPEEADDFTSKQRSRILEINRTLARFYFDCLQKPAGAAGLAYLKGRGLSNKIITHFGLGYAPNDWQAAFRFLQSKGFHPKELVAAGVAGKGGKGGYYDVYRNRVMFPIIDLRGNVVGFGGRTLDQEYKAKYLNTSDTPAFKKSHNLYALNFAKSSKRKGLLLCEGYMDVIAVHQAGFDNAVATLGTALTGEQARLIARYTDTVTLAYDSDGAGQAATARASGLLAEAGVKLRVLTMQGAKDPDEYIKKFGAERFGLLIQGASSAMDFKINNLRQKYDMESEDGKLGFLKEFVALMLEISSPVERDVYMARISTELGIQKHALETEVEYQRQRQTRKQKRAENRLQLYSEQKGANGANRAVRSLDPERQRYMKYAIAEDKLLAILLKNPDFYAKAAERIQPEDFITGQNKGIAALLFTRLSQGLPIELSFLAGSCSLEEMDAIVSLQNASLDISFSEEDMDAYIDTILSYKQQKSREEVVNMSNEDLQAYIASLASNKHKK